MEHPSLNTRETKKRIFRDRKKKQPLRSIENFYLLFPKVFKFSKATIIFEHIFKQ